jgi:hypothetical protein
MSTILERLKSGRINKSREFRFVLKTKNTPLFPLTSNDPSFHYIDILIKDIIKDGSDYIILVEHMTGSKNSNTNWVNWVNASIYDSFEIIKDYVAEESNYSPEIICS